MIDCNSVQQNESLKKVLNRFKEIANLRILEEKEPIEETFNFYFLVIIRTITKEEQEYKFRIYQDGKILDETDYLAKKAKKSITTSKELQDYFTK